MYTLMLFAGIGLGLWLIWRGYQDLVKPYNYPPLSAREMREREERDESNPGSVPRAISANRR